MKWDGIDEFLAVAESSSFSRAADQLGLSNSQVSKRVAKLEARLGARLLYRTTRRVTLTDEGRRFSDLFKGIRVFFFISVSFSPEPHHLCRIFIRVWYHYM